MGSLYYSIRSLTMEGEQMPENLITDSSKYKSIIEKYYEGQKVRAMVALQIEGGKGDEIAMLLSKNRNVRDVFLVTGDVDIVVKVSFDCTEKLLDFILNGVSKLDGVLDTNTMMILTSYKEQGRVIIDDEKIRAQS